MAEQKLVVEIEREDDGRWIAEGLALPGAMAYEQSREEARKGRSAGASGAG